MKGLRRPRSGDLLPEIGSKADPRGEARPDRLQGLAYDFDEIDRPPLPRPRLGIKGDIPEQVPAARGRPQSELEGLSGGMVLAAGQEG